MVWLLTIFVIFSSFISPLILSFSPSLGIASLPWVADLSVLLPLNYKTLYQDHFYSPKACRNSNRSSKLTCFQNVIFLNSFLSILSYVVYYLMFFVLFFVFFSVLLFDVFPTFLMFIVKCP